ncbi:MAG: glycosyltransferase [Solirubrobacterales bacterium]
MPSPRFSVITPIYETPPAVLTAMLRSVRRQSFEDWELCLVDDASPSPYVGEMLAAAAAADPRIKVTTRAANGGIVPASNDALAIAGGEFVAFLDHDDALHPDALALVAEAIGDDPTVDFVYTDEDKIDEGSHHMGPFFKPDWSPERMRTQMYTCHLSVMRRSLVDEVGGFDAEFEGSQDWDLVLRVSERARRIVHVPRVLYHWRTLATSTAGGGEEAKPWAFEAGTRAIQAHCDRTGVPAVASRDTEHPGVYTLEPKLEHEPSVSIVIPTGGTVREIRYEPQVLVERCVRSIVETSTYSNYEIVVVVDHDTDPAIFTRLAEIGGERLKLVDFDRRFNFSEKINRGAVHSDAELLLLLNDDMEVVTPNWIERLAMYASLPGVGAVGGKLIWEDGRLQHVGITFEEGGLPGHLYYGFAGDWNGYSNSVLVAENLLAVTGACMMTSRAEFDRVGGFSPTFPMNYNDMDYCLKLVSQGSRVVYDPGTVLYHFESSSRDTEVEEWEKEELQARWMPIVARDPYSNPNLWQGVPRLSSPLSWMRRRPPRLPWRR